VSAALPPATTTTMVSLATSRSRFDLRLLALRRCADMAETAWAAARAQIAEDPSDHVKVAEASAAAAVAMRAVSGAVWGES
jgi:hypothetical protein